MNEKEYQTSMTKLEQIAKNQKTQEGVGIVACATAQTDIAHQLTHIADALELLTNLMPIDSSGLIDFQRPGVWVP